MSSLLLACSLTACGSDGFTPSGPDYAAIEAAVSVDEIGPEPFAGSAPLVGSIGGIAFELHGLGFDNGVTGPGSDVIVRFTATAGTPFELGISDTVDVDGVVVSDTVITGVSPLVSASVFADVTVILLAGQVEKASATPIAQFISTAPVATDDDYLTLGNVGFAEPAATGVLLPNDFDADADPISVVAFDSMSTGGGAVTVEPDGAFSYEPALGFGGFDTFTYTISDTVLSTTATVTVEVLPPVWFLDATAPAGGDGSRNAPFASVAAFNAAQAAGGDAAPEAGDSIYMREAGGAIYDGAFALLDRQVLLGQGVELAVGSRVLEEALGNPTLRASAGYAIVLAANNEVRGLDVESAAGAIHRPDLGLGSVRIDEVNLLSEDGPAFVSLDPDSVDYDLRFGTIDVQDSSGGGILIRGAARGSLTVEVELKLRVTGGGEHGLDLSGTEVDADLPLVDIEAHLNAVHLDDYAGTCTISEGYLTAGQTCVQAVGAGGLAGSPARIELRDLFLFQTGTASYPAVEARLSGTFADEELELLLIDSDCTGAHGISIDCAAGGLGTATVICEVSNNLLSKTGRVDIAASSSGALHATILDNDAQPGAGFSSSSASEGVVCMELSGNEFDGFELSAGDDSELGLFCDAFCIITDETDAAFEVTTRNTGTVTAVIGTGTARYFDCTATLRRP